MKLASIFFTASAVYLQTQFKDNTNLRVSEQNQIYLDFEASESRFNKIKRARNMKLASIFFTVSAVYLQT